MGRAPCCDKANVKRGPWSPEEDTALKNYVQRHGTGGNWIALPQKAGLKRCGKSCRLRWLNYLRPDIKHGGFTEEEDNIICTLYRNIGSRWSVIASQLQGRTDNDVKNYWNTKLKKKVLAAQTNLAFNINITSAASAATAAATPSMTTPTIQTIKTETFSYSSLSMPPESASFTLPTFIEQPPAVTNFAGSTNGYIVSPPPQDINSTSSSSLTMDNSYGYMSWPDASVGRGGSGEDGFIMDLGFESSSDLMSWYVFNDRIGEAATTHGSNPTTISNSWSNPEHNPPQGLHQSFTYL